MFHSHLSFPKDQPLFSPAADRLSLPRSPFMPEMPRSPPKLSFGQFPESSFKWEKPLVGGFFLGRSWEDDWNIRYLKWENFVNGEWWPKKKNSNPQKKIETYNHTNIVIRDFSMFLGITMHTFTDFSPRFLLENPQTTVVSGSFFFLKPIHWMSIVFSPSDSLDPARLRRFVSLCRG